MLVYIALGSNVGDKMKNIRDAVDHLRASDNIGVCGTSFMYETEPMYVTDQEFFLNCVVEIFTSLHPRDIMLSILAIENLMGRDRVGVPNKGPRIIDLDIIACRSSSLEDPLESDPQFPGEISYIDKIVTVPHLLMHERLFVLLPFADVISDEWVHPKLHLKLDQLIARVVSELTSGVTTTKSNFPIRLFCPIHSITGPRTPQMGRYSGVNTLIMGIMNITPDSFSDGGEYYTPRITSNLETQQNSNICFEEASKDAMKMIKDGASIIDIGGESTRPGFSSINAHTERRRVIPLIKSLRTHIDNHKSSSKNVLISIDTRRSSTAKQAIAVGADIVNDPSGGTYDSEILDVVRENRKTIIITHWRDHSEEGNTYEIIDLVRKELTDRVVCAMEHGIPRWDIIIDIGLGFGKNTADNTKLLSKYHTCLPKSEDVSRSLRSKLLPKYDIYLRTCISEHNNSDYHSIILDRPPSIWPSLLGFSRKRFLCRQTGEQSKQDSWVSGNAILTAHSLLIGVDIIRVHEVAEAKHCLELAEVLYPHDGVI